jgi:hypothetical protein
MDNYYLYICRAFLSISMIISSYEILNLNSQFSRIGILNFDLNKKFRNSQFKNTLFKFPFITKSVFFNSNLLKIVLSLLLFIPIKSPVILFLLLLLIFLCILIFNYSLVFGKDGSDQMTACVLIGLLIIYYGKITSSKQIENLGILSIFIQTCLSYFVAGVAKLFGKLWLRGSALSLILSTRGFGFHYISNYFNSNKKIGLIANYLVIIIELVFPFSFLLNFKVFISILCLTGFLHLLIAYSMGLNRFFWSFISTYPILILTYKKLNS